MWQFKAITGHIFKRRTVFVDNFIFRLHYRLTFWLLLIGCTLVTARQYIGEHIHCIADHAVAPVINTFCFFSATFTVVRHHLSGVEAAHPGVGPVRPGDTITRHAYYQWVPFVLFGQALTFYLGHYIWKRLENGRISHWAEHPVPRDEVIPRLGVYSDWAKQLVLCEVINFVNLILQVMLTDKFLGGAFWSLGSQSPDNLDHVFPKVTKCTFHRYGPSGDIQVHDSLCVVALNIVNEKIFWVLWYWYLVLGVISAAGLVWRLVTVGCHSSAQLSGLVWSSATPGARLPPEQANAVARHASFCDWLFLYYLSKNIKPSEFSEVVDALSQPFLYPKLPTAPFTQPPYSKLPQQENERLELDQPDKPNHFAESDC